jgi:hypothetical protein
MHFEDLWEKCENLFSDTISADSTSDIIKELLVKINIYKTIHESDYKSEDLHNIKLRTFGEILLTLTNLSLKEQINVFKALASSYTYKAIEYYSKKHD